MDPRDIAELVYWHALGADEPFDFLADVLALVTRYHYSEKVHKGEVI